MAGKIQNEDVKTLSELTGAGGAVSQLINDTKIYVTGAGLNKQLSQAITDGDIGGVETYISNYNAESGTTGWSTYADAAGTRPVDGTGGSANVTWTQTASSPLSGSNSFLFTKDAANRQGEGVSYDFSIDNGDQAKIISIEFMYQVASGTFTAGSSPSDSDLIIYIYDVTNSQLIEPISFKLFQNSGQAIHSCTFQTNSNSTSYRLIIHVATTSASAYTVKFDNFIVGRQKYSIGTIISDWVNDSLTIGATTTAPTRGTVTEEIFRWRRVGSDMEIHWVYEQSAGGSSGSGTYLFTIPGGYVADTTKLRESTGTSNQDGSIVGEFTQTSRTGNMLMYSTTQMKAYVVGQTSEGYIGSTLGAFAGAIVYSFNAKIPILGWSSTVQASNGIDGRIVASRAKKSAGTIANNSTTAVSSWTTEEYDTLDSFNTSTGEYTVKSEGYFEIEANISFNGNGSGIRELFVQKNGSTIAGLDRQDGSANGNVMAGSTQIKCVAGDTLRVAVYQNSGGNLDLFTDSNYNTLSISKIQSPQFIAQNEILCMSSTDVQGTPTSSAFDGTATLKFSTPYIDTHGIYSTSTGLATIPVAGKYKIIARGAINATYSSGNKVGIEIYKNSTLFRSGQTRVTAALTQVIYASCETILDCLAGDTIEPRLRTAGTTPSISVDGTGSYEFSIIRMK